MKNPKIISPMATGNGAHVVHTLLERNIQNYQVISYNPFYTVFPFFLRFFCRNREPHILHTTADYAIFFKQKSIPLIISFQNYVLDRWMDMYSSKYQRIHYKTNLRLFTRMAIMNALVITAVSEFTAKIVQKDLKIKKPIHIIRNAVDENLFKPSCMSCYKNKEVRVFFSGNLTRRKGAHMLAAIADKLNKNVRIYYTQGLRTRTTLPYHDRLLPIGPVSFNDMPLRYNQMDILLMPTVREGLSLAVLEAMACGLPVVASKCSSLPEQIDENKGGFLCPVGDVNMFAESINHLADSPIKRKEMGQYNRLKVEQLFTLKRMVDEYNALFRKVVNKEHNYCTRHEFN